jgi:hypothetical protein
MRYIEPGSSPFASEFPLPSHEIDELFEKQIQKKKTNFFKKELILQFHNIGLVSKFWIDFP